MKLEFRHLIIPMLFLCVSVAVGQSRNLLSGDADVESETVSMTGGPWTNSTPEAPKWCADKTTGWKSQSSIKLLEFCGMGVKDVKLKAGKHTVSFWAKGAKQGTQAFLMTTRLNSSWPEVLRMRAKSAIYLSTEWKRYSYTFTADDGCYYSLYYGVENGPAQFDKFMLNTGETALEWEQPAKCLTLQLPEPKGNVYPFDAPVNCRVKLVRVAPEKRKKLLAIKITNYLGLTVAEYKHKIDFDSDGNGFFEFKIQPGNSGWFGIAAELPGLPGEHASLVLARPPEPVVKGIEPVIGLNKAAFYLDAAKLIGVKWLDKGIIWHLSEREKGKLKFDLDDCRDLKKQGFKLKAAFSTAAPEWMQPKEIVKKAAEHNMWIHRLVPPDDKLEVEWRNFVRNFLSDYKDVFDIYEIGLEIDVLLGMNIYYKSIYPDAIEGPYVLGKPVETVSRQIQIAAEEIKRAVPDASISAVRPSDVDSHYAYAYSKAVYQRTGKHLNSFGLDCYPQPRWIGPGRPPTGTERDLEKRRRDALAAIRPACAGNKIFVSEYGYFIDFAELHNHKYLLEQVNRLTRSYLKAKVLNMAPFFWDNAVGGELEHRYHTGLWFKEQPLPSVAALNIVGRIIENVTESVELPLHDNLCVTVYRKYDGRAAAALWSLEPGFSSELIFDDDKFEITDVMGNPFKKNSANGKIRLAITEMPVYIWRTEKNQDNYAILISALKQIHITDTTPVEITFHPTSRDTLKAYIRNTSLKTDISGVIEYEMTGRKDSTKHFAIKKGTTELVPLPLPPEGEKIALSIKFEHGVKPYTAEYTMPKLIKIARIDSCDEITKRVNPTAITGFDRITPIDHTSYNGPDDLSAKMYLAHDNRNLYFALEVTDDKHFNKFDNQELQRGDCVRLGIDTNLNFLRPADNVDSDDSFMTLALLKSGAVLSVHRGLDKNALQNSAKFKITRSEKTRLTFYQLKIPFSQLDNSLKSGRIIGFNFIVPDDDSGGGADYYLSLKHQSAGGRPDKFVQCLLE
ncbi:MAG: hypothetical protein BWY31_02030 [Lentisphaerae bacterium ADurb.Bin242]|nr:MAG: hypothetical protein BWY31_02030 [Lentisphaerae bacterium ADurb.Bin242]